MKMEFTMYETKKNSELLKIKEIEDAIVTLKRVVEREGGIFKTAYYLIEVIRDEQLEINKVESHEVRAEFLYNCVVDCIEFGIRIKKEQQIYFLK
jgi:hypothetical protein